MFFLQVVTLILFSFSSLAEEVSLKQISRWSLLLHYSNDSKKVISPQWYLSNKQTPEKELATLIDHLNSKDAQFYACEFPARTQFIMEKFQLNKKLSFDECKELNKLKKIFSKKHISLALSSEHVYSPASAFGHIMLIFHDEQYPELNSPVLNFSAVTNDGDNFFQYASKGILGYYPGYFFYEPFFKKLNEYSELEQRSLFINNLDFNEKQKDFLINHLFELKKAEFKYFFSNENCAYQINYIINLALNKEHLFYNSYFLPIDSLINQKETILDSINIDSLADKTKKEIALLNASEIKNFNSFLQKKPAELSEPVKKALINFSHYNFKHKRKILNTYEDIQKLKLTNNDHFSFNSRRTKHDIYSPKRLKIEYTLNKDKNVILGFRPTLFDTNDFQQYKNTESSFNILDIEFIFMDDLKLKKLDLIKLEFFNPIEAFMYDPSWIFETGFNRNDFDSKLTYQAAIALGHTLDIGPKLSYLIGTHANYDLSSSLTVRPVGIIRIHYYLLDSVKLNVDSRFLYENKNINEYYRVKLIKNFGNLKLYSEYERLNDNKVSIGLYYHF